MIDYKKIIGIDASNIQQGGGVTHLIELLYSFDLIIHKDSRVIIWGNHSATQYPDIHHAIVSGKPAIEKFDREWLTSNFIPVVQQRGASIINARGSSSAASAASAAIDHMHDWILGTPDDDWVSMGIPSNGSYGIKPGIIFSYPVRCINGGYEIIENLEINNFSRKLILASEIELREERAAIEELL